MPLKTDHLGIPRFTNRDLVDMIYSGDVDKCHEVLCDPSEDVDLFNSTMQEQGLSQLQKYTPIDVDQEQFDRVCQSEWFMPDEYKVSNTVLKHKLLKMCKTSEEEERVLEEYNEFEQREMLDLLKYMIYLVNFMRENNIVWGVGRGSSVASYILYLIGVHRIDSIKYNLDWHEFLR
jgi:DNA polymerase III alpha subunit